MLAVLRAERYVSILTQGAPVQFFTVVRRDGTVKGFRRRNHLVSR